jgi:hypothetical protein
MTVGATLDGVFAGLHGNACEKLKTLEVNGISPVQGRLVKILSPCS